MKMNKVQRRLLLSADILITLAAAALIPLNLLVLGFPEWVTFLAVALLVTVNGAYFEKIEPSHRSRLLMLLLTVPVVLALLVGSYCNPYWNSLSFRKAEGTKAYDEVLTQKEALSDLNQAMRYLRKCHPVFGTRDHLKMMEQDKVMEQYHEVKARLEESDEITVSQLRREISGIFSVLHDAHTSVWSQWSGERYLCTIDARRAEGWELAAINGRSPEQLFAENKSLFSYEAESWGLHSLRNCLTSLSGLDYLGISADGVQYTWRNGAGEKETETHTVADFLPYDEYVIYNQQYRAGQDEEPYVEYSIDEARSLALLTLRSCTYSQTYIDCLRNMFTEVREKGLQNVAVDLRGNGGGASWVVNEFLRYLPVESYREEGSERRLGLYRHKVKSRSVTNDRYTELVFDGNVYVLTDASTFSSAMMFAEFIADNRLGSVIGEPPGNAPSGYGDVAVFRLPCSGLYYQVSTTEFSRIDGETDDVLIQPDIPCDGAEALDTLYSQLGATA